MNLTIVENFLRQYRHADIIEAVVDTTCSNGATVPFLNLWAWRLSPAARLEEAQRKVSETGDLGFWYDVLDELGSLAFEVALAEDYPEWPADITEGDALILAQLAALAKEDALRGSGNVRWVFHHVDTWPLIDLCT